MGSSTKRHVFREMQFVSHCYTVVSLQPVLRHSLYKNSAVYLSGARVRFFFLDIRDLGSPLYIKRYYWQGPNKLKFTQLMSTEHYKTLNKPQCFIEKGFQFRKELLLL